MGALLTAGYATRLAREIAASSQSGSVPGAVEGQLQKSYTGAAEVAARYPAFAQQITTAARESFVQGQRWAITVGLVAMLGGVVLVWLMFPRHDRELELLHGYAEEDAEAVPA
jgi:MFS transporter, DHA2 family, multidrug resistance protein